MTVGLIESNVFGTQVDLKFQTWHSTCVIVLACCFRIYIHLQQSLLLWSKGSDDASRSDSSDINLAGNQSLCLQCQSSTVMESCLGFVNCPLQIVPTADMPTRRKIGMTVWWWHTQEDAVRGTSSGGSFESRGFMMGPVHRSSVSEQNERANITLEKGLCRLATQSCCTRPLDHTHTHPGQYVASSSIDKREWERKIAPLWVTSQTALKTKTTASINEKHFNEIACMQSVDNVWFKMPKHNTVFISPSRLSLLLMDLSTYGI